MPEYMDGVSSEDWRVVVEHEYVYRAALDEARRNVEAELARPHERNLSNLGVSAVATFVFGTMSAALFALGFSWWSLLPLALLVPALVLGLYFGRKVIQEGADSADVR
ncbi:hypothetical protein [Streptomyces tanashiensis]|uniref:hypothetical protein n=1 Tax=Streptomyces tanashiensis TaxID=67367 RepID=UPI003422435A